MSGWNPSGQYTPDPRPTRKVLGRDIRVGDTILCRGSEFWGADKLFHVEWFRGRTAYYGDPRTTNYGWYYIAPIEEFEII